MIWGSSPYILALLLAAALAAGVIVSAWRRRSVPGAAPLALLMVAVAEWSLGYALELGSAALRAKITWAKLEYLGIVAVPVVWLVFALQYTGRERWMARRNLALLIVIPLLTLLMVWTNDRHGLIWSSTTLHASGTLLLLQVTYGAWFWVHTAYSYLLLLVGTVLLIWASFHSWTLYRRRTVVMLMGTLVPWLGNILHLADWHVIPELDLTPFAFTVTGLMLSWALFHYHLLDVVPVARGALIERMDDIVIVLDAQGHVVDLNPAAGDILACRVSEAIGQSVAQVFSHQIELVHHYRHMAEGHAEIMLSKGEKPAHFDLRLLPLYDRHGHATGCLMVLRDIAELKRAEEALRRAHAELELRVQQRTAELAQAIQAMQAEIAERKHAEERLQYRLAIERATALASGQLVAPEGADFHQILEILGEVVAANRSYIFQFREGDIKVDNTCEWCSPGTKPQIDDLQGLDMSQFPWFMGKLKRAEATLVPDVDALPDEAVAEKEMLQAQSIRSLLFVPINVGTTLTGFMGFDDTGKCRDWLPEDVQALRMIANTIGTYWERKQAEEALRESERKYRQLVDLAQEGIWVVDAQNITTFVNPRMAAILGYTAGEMLGRSLFSFMDERGVEIAEANGERHKQGISEQHDLEFLRKDGTRVLTIMATSPIMDEAGHYAGALAVVADITERRRLEEQLRQAQKMEAIGRLAGGIAHDFNNLLTVITGYGQMVHSGLAETNPLRADMTEVLKAGERATALTKQLLAFSRRQVLDARVLDLNDVIEGSAKMLRRLIGEDVNLTLELAPTLGGVKADPSQIEQVLLNLAANARDAMPTGGTLFISTANVSLDAGAPGRLPDAPAGPYVMLAVSDTGHGLSPEVREHLFEPFFTTKDHGKGTGLGLSTVYGIVRQSGGEIHVYSELGRGTTFKVYLPRVEAPRMVAPAERVTALPRGHETILVVEDQVEVRELTVRVLRSLGYNVLQVSRGAEALEVVAGQSAPLHLLLTDVVMPEMGAVELVEQLRQKQRLPKVLYMSGYTDDIVVRHGITESGVPFIQKPFSVEALAQKVRQVLDS